MEISPTAEAVALVLTFVVHVIGAAVLIWVMLGDGEWSWRDIWPHDDDGGGGDLPDGPQTPSNGPDGLPLPADAQPARVRLRQPGRISAGKPRPARRPVHAPTREPAPARDRDPA